MQSRTYRAAAALALCVLTVTAGCSAITGDGGGSPDAYTGQNEDLNLTELESDHAAVVSNASSYTLDLSFTVGNATRRPIVTNQTMRVDREDDRAFAEMYSKFFTESRTFRYTKGGATYQKRVQNPSGDGNVSYTSASEPYDGSVQPVNTSADVGLPATDAVEWSRSDVTSEGDTTLTTYEVGSVLNESKLPSSQFFAQNASIEEVTGTLVVTEDGLVREYTLAYTFTPEEQDYSTTIRISLGFSAVNGTSVEDPDWLSKAS
jgi:hypothetical protein